MVHAYEAFPFTCLLEHPACTAESNFQLLLELKIAFDLIHAMNGERTFCFSASTRYHFSYPIICRFAQRSFVP